MDQKKYFTEKKLNMLNTLNKDIAKKHFRNGFNIGIVKVNTLNYFLKKFYKASKKIDLLKIDVEGEELKVLHSVDFKHYKPSLISIEIHNQKSMYQDNSYYFKTNKIYKFLIQKNYKLIWKKKYSFIFKRKNN